MAITETLEAYKTLIENLPSKPVVRLFEGVIENDKLGNLQMSSDRCYVLVSYGGGDFITDGPRLVCDSNFGAFIIAGCDQDTYGVSRKALKLVHELVIALKTYRGSSRNTLSLPKINGLQPATTGFKSSNNNFGSYLLTWTHWVGFD